MKVVIDIKDDYYYDIIGYAIIGEFTKGEIINAIRNGTPLKWIPVSERPKDRQRVLFCDIDNDIMIGYHVKSRPNTHFTQDGTYEDVKNVRAWVPLLEVVPTIIEAGSEEV